MWLGTKKYLSAPVTTTSYSTQIELPIITICHTSKEGSFGTDDNYEAYFGEGNFLDEGSSCSAEVLYQQRTDQNYYRLDGTGTINKYTTKNYFLFQVNNTNEVSVTVDYVDDKGEESNSLVDPTSSRVLDSFGSKCASFDLESYSIQEITDVMIEGTDITVFLHEQDKFPLKELSSVFNPIDKHEVTVSASKIIDKDSDKAPCYKGEA